MKLVVISQRADSYPERKEQRDALDKNMNSLVLQVGYLPVPIPNNLVNGNSRGEIDEWLEAINPHAVILSGGNNIGECTERDLTESTLLKYAEKKRRPLLGICRGMQMLGVHAGVQLRNVEGHVRVKHNLKGEISGLVNSYHNMAIAECPSNYTVLARSEDSVIEAIHHNEFPWEGWMWHPERVEQFQSRDLERLKVLFGR